MVPVLRSARICQTRNARSDHDASASKGYLCMNPAQKALWFIEGHLADALTLDEIAAVAGISRFHLVRAFAAATGLPVMRYVRARRLTEAARALAARRTRYPRSRAGGGLRLSRSIHPRVPRPFRGDARSGPRPRRALTASNFRSRSSWTRRLPITSRRRALRPARPFSSRVSASATIGKAAPHSGAVAALQAVGRAYP